MKPPDNPVRFTSLGRVPMARDVSDACVSWGEYTDRPMISISESTLSVALCDQYAFYPFRALVQGGVGSWEVLNRAEQFARTVLLHDYVEMDGEPMRSPEEEPEWTEEEIAAGRRPVVTSFMPILTGYENVVCWKPGPTRELNLELRPELVRLAASSAGTDRDGDPYLRTHLQYLRNVCLVVMRGGSVLAAGEVGRAAKRIIREPPMGLLRHLDDDVRRLAEQANRGDLGLVMQPFLAIVIGRAGTRDRMVEALVGLREEWAEPRRRIWETLHALRRARHFQECEDLRRELDRVSRSIRAPGAAGSKPIEVAWQVTTAGFAGALGAWIGSGNPLLGAAVPAALRVASVAGTLGPELFGLGGFGLARAINREVRAHAPSVDQLRALLAEDEKGRLGL